MPVVAALALSFVASMLLVFQVQEQIDAAAAAGQRDRPIGYENGRHALELGRRAAQIAGDSQLPEHAGDGPRATARRLGRLPHRLALRADPLTAVMLAIVTCISTLVAIYSIGYMHGDPGYWRFFTYIGLFVFSMTMLVSASNFVLLYVFWEAVGLCSYLLIGFWYRKARGGRGRQEGVPGQPHRRLRLRPGRVPDLDDLRHARSSTTRVGVPCGVLGQTRLAAPELFAGGWQATAICLLLLLGACGKSAQFPLHVWLPDAMEGPTPVSALIHAATMVTAGVYLVARCMPLFAASPDAQYVVAVDRRHHGPAGRDHRHHPDRPETDPGLLDHQPSRLHVPRPGHGHAAGRDGRHVPPADPRLLQGPAVPRRRQRDARDGRRDRHPPPRRPAAPHARHALDVPGRLPGHRGRRALRRLLEQGRDPAGAFGSGAARRRAADSIEMLFWHGDARRAC